MSGRYEQPSLSRNLLMSRYNMHMNKNLSRLRDGKKKKSIIINQHNDDVEGGGGCMLRYSMTAAFSK